MGSLGVLVGTFQRPDQGVSKDVVWYTLPALTWVGVRNRMANLASQSYIVDGAYRCLNTKARRNAERTSGPKHELGCGLSTGRNNSRCGI